MLNAVLGRSAVKVSRTPGRTRYFQTHFLTPTVRLCDCPGLVFPSRAPRELQVGPRPPPHFELTRRPWPSLSPPIMPCHPLSPPVTPVTSCQPPANPLTPCHSLSPPLPHPPPPICLCDCPSLVFLSHELQVVPQPPPILINAALMASLPPAGPGRGVPHFPAPGAVFSRGFPGQPPSPAHPAGPAASQHPGRLDGMGHLRR